jgi:glucose/arabinose dehydrogenase
MSNKVVVMGDRFIVKSLWWVVFCMTLALGGVLSVVHGQDTPITTRDSAPDASKYQLVEVVSGFNRPVFVTGAGDGSGRLFIMEQDGKIFVMVNGALQETPFLDVSKLVSRNANERGLLGLAFHPKYTENGTFFIDYTDKNGDTAIAKYTVSGDNPNVADPASAQIILGIKQPYANHNGGMLAFGPDSYLYIGMGDGGSEGDPHGNGQNYGVLLAKILRIDVDNGTPYGIPADNPSSTNPAFAPEAWATGLRNPWRFSFDRATGDLYIGDVGQNQWEEVDFQPADSKGGENYGWNIMEGTHSYSGVPAPSGLTAPFFDYSHDNGCSVTGGYVYRGKALPDLQGVYFFGDYCSGTIWASYRDTSGAWQTNVFMDSHLAISSFGQDEDGELYVVNHGGSVLRLQER